MKSSARSLVLTLAAAMLGGCASLPPPADRPASHAVHDDTTPLARIAAAGRPEAAQALSGFRLLPTGGFSFHARKSLAERATRTIDAQYYLLKNDPVGRSLLVALRDAAARGVRVRLLVDDLFVGGEEALFTGLAAHANVEVRYYNPLPVRRGPVAVRLLFSLHEFSRINHRMHNKLFVADGAIAVTGGRNVAEEYFMASDRANFIDLDLLVTGAAVGELSASFDSYWNSAHVRPAEEIASRRTDAAEARAAFAAMVAGDVLAAEDFSLDPLRQASVTQELNAGRLTQVFAPARVFVDSPDKAADHDLREASAMMRNTLEVIGSARSDVVLVSPYFIPGAVGMRMMREAKDRGVTSILLTNALGSTDEPLVHARYSTYRKPMLELGVRIFELSPTGVRDSREFGNFRQSTPRLHAKAAIVDHRYVFVGSMNLDGRSALANTELGIVVDSPELAAQLRSLTLAAGARGIYEVRVATATDRLEWVWRDARGREEATTDEPDDSWWRRLRVWLLAPWVPEELL